MPQLPPEGGPKQARIEGPQEVRAFDDRGGGGEASLDHAPSATDEAEPTVKEINLALQGGGAHGAFAWGVLDYLLEDGRLAFEAISATSAGAVNAVLCASGMLTGGREGARLALRDFWRAVAETGETYRPLTSNWLAILFGAAQLDFLHLFSFLQMPDKAFSPYLERMMELNPFLRFFAGNTGSKREPPSRNFVSQVFQTLSAMFSPYYFNPTNHNPLKNLLEAHVDFAALQSARDTVKLHICATNVETGKIRVFRNAELTADAASPPPFCRFCFRLPKSTANITGTAAIWATRRSFHSFMKRNPAMWSSSISTRLSARAALRPRSRS